ncbi:S8 family serine peptidase [Chitinimonas sp. PSY-7]|uniref:S8 family serine peptidase n=1 Tax=Chitinimonas sp. PSY-7 TaxID=3459088 RepID=UPI00404005E3
MELALHRVGHPVSDSARRNVSHLAQTYLLSTAPSMTPKIPCRQSFILTRNLVIAIGGFSFMAGSAVANTTGQDPLYQYQWHLKNTGQAVFADIRPTPGIDLNIGTLHAEGITGKGVVIGLMDSKQAYSDHPDLKPNMVLQGANDPSQDNFHATAVAAIMVGVAGNSQGGRGVAPDAKILDMNIPGSRDLPTPRVTNNSMGGQPPLFMTYGVDNIADLYNPLTTLIVHAAGNSFLRMDTNPEALCEQATQRSGVGCIVANTDLMSNWPNTIAVGAVNAAGKKSSYSQTGSVLWVSGLGGEQGWQRRELLKQYPVHADAEKADRQPERYFAPALVTANTPGCDKGVNKGGKPFNELDSGSSNSYDPTCSYTAMANGTSSAAPTVTGVIALMLQVNPRLSWRDIKYILATTARQVDAEQSGIRWNGMLLDSGWVTNAAGHTFSNWYGFGLVDATKAVDRARNFVTLPTLYQGGWQSSTGSPVPIAYRRDDAGTSDITIEEQATIETVQLQLNTTSKNPGNLRVMLVSPSGTRSIILPALTLLLPTPDGFSIDLTASNAFLDERSKGVWKLQIVDMVDPSSESTQAITSWKLRVLGH